MIHTDGTPTIASGTRGHRLAAVFGIKPEIVEDQHDVLPLSDVPLPEVTTRQVSDVDVSALLRAARRGRV